VTRNGASEKQHIMFKNKIHEKRIIQTKKDNGKGVSLYKLFRDTKSIWHANAW